MANDLSQNNYHLETLYLLPTDIFENQKNYDILDSEDFIRTAKLFDYIGIASTLEHGVDQIFFDKFWQTLPHQNIELHLNLIEEKLTSKEYLQDIKSKLKNLKTFYGEKILVNMALNVGTDWSESELTHIKNTVSQLSEDQIIELNFTFMYNNKILRTKKAELIQMGYPVLNYFSTQYDKNEKAFNERTALRKPSFTFKDDSIFVSPILPFDEYVFLEDKKFQLEAPSFEAFLETHSKLEFHNKPILKRCESCLNLATCQGKHFFTLAHELSLPCFKGYRD